MKGRPGADRVKDDSGNPIREFALRAKVEDYLLLGWYRGNASRPLVVDRGFFDL